MAQAKATKDYNTFVKGLITEANPLTYPENSSIDEQNMILNRDGSRQRRFGMDYEVNYELSADIPETSFSGKAVSTSVWKNAGNDGTEFSVVQTGEIIRFYKVSNSNTVSSEEHTTTIDLTTYKLASVSNIGSEPIGTSYGKGLLFISSKEIESLYVEYTPTTDAITVTQIDIEVRDFWGVDDGLEVDERPSTLSNTHKYNLLNQGWTSDKITTYKSGSSGSLYPSNSQIWTVGKDTNEDFTAALLDKMYFGNSRAPQGHYILNLFNRDRTTASGEPGLTTEVDNGRPSTVAFYAGRVWHAGIQSDTTSDVTLNGTVLYSQLIDDTSRIGKCYQDADPTSEQISDLIATDGGLIPIQGATRIWKILEVRNSLVVFADNGIWQITGDSDSGFTPESNQLVKITDVGSLNSRSIVVVENVIFYWSEAGIYILQPSEVTGLLTAQNISIGTIQSLYNEISSSSKRYSTGSYDPTSKKLSWLYNTDTNYSGLTYKNKYDGELIFDTTLSAFYKNKIGELSSFSPYVASHFQTPSGITGTNTFNIIVETGEQVETATLDLVVVDQTVDTRGTSSTKYLTVIPQSSGTHSKITFSEYNNSNFLDWEIADSTGVDSPAYLDTGHELAGDTKRYKGVTYLIMNFKRTETAYEMDGTDLVFDNPSSCMVQARWEWSDSSNSGRWTTPQQMYRLNRHYLPSGVGAFDYGFSVITTKNKLRGKGRAISLHIESEAGKDMHLLGWGMVFSGNVNV